MGLDTVEIVLEIEEAFDIQIPDEAAEKIQTVGQLYDYVVEQTCDGKERPADDVPARTDICLTAATFYLVRSELCTMHGLDRRQIRPRTPLENLLPRSERRRDWQELERKLDLKLPALVRPTWVVALAIGVCLVTTIAAASWFAHPLVLSLILIAGAVAAYWLTKPLANHFPSSCPTMGALCVSLLELNYRRLLARFQRLDPSDVFQTIKMILVEQLNVDPALVTRDASFVNDLGMD